MFVLIQIHRAQDRGYSLVVEEKSTNQLVSFVISEDYNSPLYGEHEFDNHIQLAPVYSLLNYLHNKYHHMLKSEGFMKGENVGDARIVHLAYGGTATGYEGKGLSHWLISEHLRSFRERGYERALGVTTSDILSIC